MFVFNPIYSSIVVAAPHAPRVVGAGPGIEFAMSVGHHHELNTLPTPWPRRLRGARPTALLGAAATPRISVVRHSGSRRK
jgi:hypothetical protein